MIPRWFESRALRTFTGDSSDASQMPLIAIVGPPRVGSTFLYQLIASRFQVQYFDNIQHTFLRYPLTAWKLSRLISPPDQRRIAFDSDHGFVKGVTGISEGNFFWEYWYDMPIEEKLSEPLEWRLDHVRRFFDYIHTRRDGVPFLTSYNSHSFYLSELTKRFEKLLVIGLRRDPLATALSIYRGRLHFRKDPNHWWSIRPRACSDEGDVFDQIACQVAETYRSILRELDRVPNISFLSVWYEDLCAQPEAFLQYLGSWAGERGVPLHRRMQAPHLKRFNISVADRTSTEAPRFEERLDAFDWDGLAFEADRWP